MPLPKPHKGESQSDFVGRCMHEAYGDNAPPDRTQDQAVAMCMQAWRDGNKSIVKQCSPPEDGESFEDFMDRCTDEMDEDACQMMWDNRAAKNIKHKTHTTDKIVELEFVLSDESVDRMDDIIMADGWEIENFKKNPIALFNHNPNFIVGKWDNLRVEGKQLRGHLGLAPAGTSPRIDELRKLIEAGILKATSVGFRPLDAEPIDKNNPFSGHRFKKQELVETSLVAVPANANCLAVAKSLNISPQTIDLVFAKHGNRGAIMRRGFTGEHANATRNGKGSAMSGLAQRIINLETQIVAKRDLLEEQIEKLNDETPNDADLEAADATRNEIVKLEKTRTALVESEKVLKKNLSGDNDDGQSRALTVIPQTRGREHVTRDVKSPAIILNRKKELDMIDYLVRGAVVTYLAKAENRAPHEVRQRIYPDDEPTQVMVDIVTRAASAPAMTTVTGWAAELVHTQWADLMPLLLPKSILNRLAPRGLALDFGAFGKIIIPTRSRTPSLAGSFVGEGLAIPVRQGAFTSQTLTPKKMAVISTWTREMGDHSIPAIEGLIREAIRDDTTVAIDSVLIDSNAATTIRPAGLLNGVSVTSATAGGGIAALVGDLVGLISAISTATYGNVRNLVWLANQTDMLRASLLSATNTGIFPFREEIRNGTLATIPIIDSATVTAKTLILIDAADFVVVGGDAPRMEMSDQATLHMEDTSPADLVASPSTVAAPQRSLFQTDSLALRMVLPLNWTQRRAGTVAYTTSVTW
jgi:HK97 family phage major capsid protein/HK97 family phage prohead protease